MPSFIYTPKGYVNLDKVEVARHVKSSPIHYKISVDDETMDTNHPMFGTTIISIIPIIGEWEYLSPCEEENGSYTAYSEPVIAWGLTAVGSVVPVTPTTPEGPQGIYALRKSGDSRVWESEAEYENAKQWLENYAALQKKRK